MRNCKIDVSLSIGDREYQTHALIPPKVNVSAAIYTQADGIRLIDAISRAISSLPPAGDDNA